MIPPGIREEIVERLTISPSLIRKTNPIASGFASSSCNTEVHEVILEAKKAISLSGTKLEPATNLGSTIILTVPAFIKKLKGKLEVRKSLPTDEIELVGYIRPVHLKICG